LGVLRQAVLLHVVGEGGDTCEVTGAVVWVGGGERTSGELVMTMRVLTHRLGVVCDSVRPSEDFVVVEVADAAFHLAGENTPLRRPSGRVVAFLQEIDQRRQGMAVAGPDRRREESIRVVRQGERVQVLEWKECSIPRATTGAVKLPKGIVTTTVSGVCHVQRPDIEWLFFAGYMPISGQNQVGRVGVILVAINGVIPPPESLGKRNRFIRSRRVLNLSVSDYR
jgi:hypothetical protein